MRRCVIGNARRAGAAARRVAVVSARLRGCDLHHPRRLLLGRQAPLWCKLINQVRQMLTEASEQIVHAQAGLLAQRVERIAAERILQILGRDLLVRAGADPGLRDAAMSAVLQFFYDVPEAAAQHAARRGAAEHTAQSAGEEVTQAATGLGAGGCATRHAGRLAAEQSAADIPEASARTAGTHSAAWRYSARLTHAARRGCLAAPALEPLVGEEPQQRHHDRRHTAAASAAGLALAARAIHHTGKDIRQSHVCLLVLMSDAAPSDLAPTASGEVMARWGCPDRERCDEPRAYSR